MKIFIKRIGKFVWDFGGLVGLVYLVKDVKEISGAINEWINFKDNVLIAMKATLINEYSIIIFAMFLYIIVGYWSIAENNKSKLFIKRLLPRKKAQEITVGKLTAECLNAYIVIKDIFDVNIQPSVDNFINEVYIKSPYCPDCEETLSEVLDKGELIGYMCIPCRTQVKVIKDKVLFSAKKKVRHNFIFYWEAYRREKMISQEV